MYYMQTTLIRSYVNFAQVVEMVRYTSYGDLIPDEPKKETTKVEEVSQPKDAELPKKVKPDGISR